ncbi:MAG: hypothetical protein KKA84_15855 [Bacteroidetes bacterium]|nr:hypothetical protein [Bacteroidota bacterium]
MIKYQFEILFLLAMIVVNTTAQPKIILKLDDLQATPALFDKCLPVFDYLAANSVKASWGVCRLQNVDDSQIAILSNYKNITDTNGDPVFEFWNHGLDHSRNNPMGTWEFSGTPHDFQKTHFDSANILIKDKLGIIAHTFGAPYNHIDSYFLQILSENENIKVLLLGELTPDRETGIINLTNRVNMESAVGVVDFDYFMENFETSKEIYKDYIIIQGHPPYWNEEAFLEFRRIIEFLVAKKCEFVTPIQYYLSNHDDGLEE